MVIKASAAIEIRQLIGMLGSDDDVSREAAIARLAIIGARAVDRLVAAYHATDDPQTRIGILRALEPAADARAVAVARRALVDGGDLAVAAAGVLRGSLDAPHGPAAAEALDALMGVALDPSADHRVRLAALEGLQDVPGALSGQLAEALLADPDPAIRGRAAGAPQDAAASEAVWLDALEGRLPAGPEPLRDALRSRGPAAPLTSLQTLIDVVRAHEGAIRAAKHKTAWCAFRGSVHQALALRGSRLALYDLRETLEQAREPLPASFLAALHVLGDESCLEQLAAVHERAQDDRWKLQLRDTFRAILRRERITRRHVVMKRIAARWPGSLRELAGSA